MPDADVLIAGAGPTGLMLAGELALAGVDVVYHAAAMVSDWGPWEDFRSVTVEGTRNMLQAATAARVSAESNGQPISVAGVAKSGAALAFPLTRNGPPVTQVSSSAVLVGAAPPVSSSVLAMVCAGW